MNVEIKARLSDRDALLRRLEPMAEKHTVLRQKDTFFRVAHGRLKLRRSTVCGDGTPGASSLFPSIHRVSDWLLFSRTAPRRPLQPAAEMPRRDHLTAELEESCSLFFYDRPDARGPKLSRYQRLPLDGETAALTLQDMLDRSLGTLGTVCKERHLFLVGCTRVHVDAVQGLGDFLELEVVLREGQDPEEGRATAEALMAVLGVQPDSLESGSYLDLLALH
ncbi:uncharacterized protein ISCGN_030459 [Ixodes scapularis]